MPRSAIDPPFANRVEEAEWVQRLALRCLVHPSSVGSRHSQGNAIPDVGNPSVRSKGRCKRFTEHGRGLPRCATPGRVGDRLDASAPGALAAVVHGAVDMAAVGQKRTFQGL